MTDLISRQAALDCFHEWVDKHGNVYQPDDMPEYMEIEDLPSAEPISQIKWERDTAIAQLKELGYGLGEKPKKGKWIIHDEGANAYECSCCGLAWCLFDGEPKDNNMNYCPKCGADMRGEKDGNQR